MTYRKDNSSKSYTTLSFFKIWALVLLFLFLAGILIDCITRLSIGLYIIGFVALISLLLILRIVQLVYQRLEDRKFDYRQIESLHNLYHHLSPKVLLPNMRNHASSPDFLILVIEILERTKPGVIVETGSGTSTIVISEWLAEHLPDTIHIALEHKSVFARRTMERIRNQNTHVIHAPMNPYHIDGETFQWYDLETIKDLHQIDLLIVDGPPGPVNKYARFPALPLLQDKMTSMATVLLDDGIRADEQEIARRWSDKYDLELTYHDLEKGAFELSFEYPKI